MVWFLFQKEENHYLFNGRKFKIENSSCLLDINEKAIPAVNSIICVFYLGQLKMLSYFIIIIPLL